MDPALHFSVLFPSAVASSANGRTPTMNFGQKITGRHKPWLTEIIGVFLAKNVIFVSPFGSDWYAAGRVPSILVCVGKPTEDRTNTLVVPIFFFCCRS